jgi:hypothetical protein
MNLFDFVGSILNIITTINIAAVMMAILTAINNIENKRIIAQITQIIRRVRLTTTKIKGREKPAKTAKIE